jgi:hypothetical protein
MEGSGAAAPTVTATAGAGAGAAAAAEGPGMAEVNAIIDKLLAVRGTRSSTAVQVRACVCWIALFRVGVWGRPAGSWGGGLFDCG